jgi:hypothetical protein
VAAYPDLVWIVRGLLVSAMVGIASAIGLRLSMLRRRARRDERAASAMLETVHRIAKMRARMLILGSSIFILWVVETMLIGPSRFRTEILLVMTLGLVILPAVVIVSIVSTTFRRAAETVAGDASRNA